jgi:D-alanyl-D-alanine dipeptidase
MKPLLVLVGTMLQISVFANTPCTIKMSDMAFIDLQELAPSIVVDMPYATKNNFTGKIVYPENPRALLRRPVAEALAKAQAEFRKKGLSLKIWDAYRPFSIQEVFWKVMPDARYVAEPVRGENGELVKGSVHSRGAAVDVTLLDENGTELEMPTLFDDFSERAHRTSSDASATALANRAYLEEVMARHGFVGLPTEWWHFDFKENAQFPLSDEPMVSGAEPRVVN